MHLRSVFIQLLFFSLLGSGIACNQPQMEPVDDSLVGNRKSPISISSIKEGNTYIKVVYGQPYRKGRTIFGELEPYGSVWRTGANEATEITFTQPVLFGQEAIDAGTYALFSIPNESSWTIILNNELGQWGAFDYNEEFDYARIEIPVQELESPVEAFTISFEDANNSLTTMSLAWDVVRIDIPIRFYSAN